jgi:hypothetical protein
MRDLVASRLRVMCAAQGAPPNQRLQWSGARGLSDWAAGKLT